MTYTLRVVGLGGLGAGDDAVGLRVVELLSRSQRDLELVRARSAADVVPLLVSTVPVVLVDAVVDRRWAPGTVLELGPDDLGSAERCPVSSHGFDLKKAIDLARALYEAVQPDVRIVAIVVDPRRCTPSMEISPALDLAAGQAARRIEAWGLSSPGSRSTNRGGF